MLELSQLNCFVAAAEELHFGRAATRLNMTQATLSRPIQALEHALKVGLFERANRTVRLTSAGRVFLPEAKRILAMMESATNWTRRAWQGEAGVIRLGFVASAAFVDLPDILRQAKKDLPDVQILLKEMTTTAQKDAILADMIDVAILRPPIDHGKFGVFRIRTEQFFAALHAGDPRATKAKLTLQDFDRQNYIMYSTEGAGYSHAMLTAMFDRAGVAPIMVHHLDQNHSILSLVSAGLGAALVAQGVIRLSFENVVYRPVDTEPARPLEMYMLWRNQNENPALPAFLALCRSLFGGEAKVAAKMSSAL
jgi:DNA-binding transcriptional LysR family regulator